MRKLIALAVASVVVAAVFIAINLYVHGMQTNFLGIAIVSPIMALLVTGPVALGLGAKDPVRTSAALALVFWLLTAAGGAYFFGFGYSTFDLMMGGATMVIIGASSGIAYKGVVG